jgi:chromosomal replication initiation ATPase DnaA
MILTFDWGVNYSLNSFVVGKSNRNAFDWLNSDFKWPSNHALLYGPSYSGKTHLANIWSKHKLAFFIDKNFVNKNYSFNNQPLIVDFIENFDNERHLMNIFYHTISSPVLWLSKNRCLDFKLNDLKTRFNSMITFGIEEPDSDLFKKILIKRCLDYGIELNPDCAEYLVRRSDLNYRTINNLANIIHETCLAQCKSPSIYMMHGLL